MNEFCTVIDFISLLPDTQRLFLPYLWVFHVYLYVCMLIYQLHIFILMSLSILLFVLIVGVMAHIMHQNRSSVFHVLAK